MFTQLPLRATPSQSKTKPHLRQLPYSRLWLCAYLGWVGFGDSPSDAYYDMLGSVDVEGTIKRGIAEQLRDSVSARQAEREVVSELLRKVGY